MFLLCRLLSRICEYLLLRAGDAASVEMAQASPSSHAKMPVAPVMANLQPASGARPSRQGGAMREFYWAEDVHKMLDMTNASLKDMARAGQSSHAMISELTDQVEEMKKVNALLMEELKLASAAPPPSRWPCLRTWLLIRVTAVNAPRPSSNSLAVSLSRHA